VLYAAGPSVNFYDGGATHIVFENLRTHERHSLLDGASYPRYLDAGYLLYSSDGVLHVRPLEWPRSTLPGPVAEFAEHVATGTLNGGASGFAVSRSGTLVLAPARERPLIRPVWVDTAEHIEALPLPPGRYSSPKLSPDGTQLALTVSLPETDIWVYDIARGTSTKLTDDGASQWPVWTPDGRRIAYASTATGQVRLLWKPVDGSAVAELLASGAAYAPRAFTGDGALLLFDDVSPATTAIRGLAVDTLAVVPVLQTSARVAWGALSPDGRWLAYVSEESGRDEVYVQPFPGPGLRWQVSTEEGREPLWDRDGRQLFFRKGGEIWSATVRSAEPGSITTPFATLDPRLVVSGSFVSSWALSYDVASDGRFLMLAVEQSATSVSPNPIVIVNWSETLSRTHAANTD
jgi:dipeptidyl aminopeptidase/acylaminoacyl peptidase